MARTILVRFDLSGMTTACIGVTLLPIGYTDAIADDEAARTRTFSVIVPYGA